MAVPSLSASSYYTKSSCGSAFGWTLRKPSEKSCNEWISSNESKCMSNLSVSPIQFLQMRQNAMPAHVVIGYKMTFCLKLKIVSVSKWVTSISCLLSSIWNNSIPFKHQEYNLWYFNLILIIIICYGLQSPLTILCESASELPIISHSTKVSLEKDSLNLQ